MHPVRAGEPVRLTLDTGRWSASQRSCHINVLEMQAVIYAMRDFLPRLRSWVVRLMCDNAVTYIKNKGGGHQIAHFDADDHTAAQVLRQQGDYVGFPPSARSAQHPGGFSVQSRPDTDHGVDDGHGESTTRVCQVGRATDRFVCDICQQTTRQVRIAVSGPQGRVDRCHVHALGLREGPSCTRSRHSRWSRKYCRRSLSHQEWRWFWSLNCNRQHHGSQSWWTYPKKIRFHCSLKVKTYWHKTFARETGWPRTSLPTVWKLPSPSWEQRIIPEKLPTWCQGAVGNLHNKCMNPIGQDLWRSVGRKDGKCFESEVIISAPTWCTSSGTDYFHRR